MSLADIISAACCALASFVGLNVTLAGIPAMPRNQLTRRKTASLKRVELVPGMQLATTALLLMGTPSEEV